MLVLFGELALNGYVLGVGAEGHGAPAPRRAGAAAAPADVTAGGPVLRLTPDGRAQTSAVPAGTVALTFDDGPDPRWTPQVLDVLRRHHAHATFFVIGSRVNQYPDLARRIVAEGNELGVHTFTHVELATVPSWQRRLELTLGQNAIVGATGRQPTLMRPPYASEPNALTGPDFEALRDVAAAGYLTVLADRDTDDWRRPGLDAIVRAATPETGPRPGPAALPRAGLGRRAGLQRGGQHRGDRTVVAGQRLPAPGGDRRRRRVDRRYRRHRRTAAAAERPRAAPAERGQARRAQQRHPARPGRPARPRRRRHGVRGGRRGPAAPAVRRSGRGRGQRQHQG